MPFRLLGWTVVGAVLAAGAVVGYEVLRASLFGFSPSHLETGIIVGSVAAALVAITIWWTAAPAPRREFESFNRNLSALLNESTPVPEVQIPEELRQGVPYLEELITRYRENLLEQQVEGWPMGLGRADSEEGESHSLVHRRAADASGTARDMICRLAPDLFWLAATPALQRFLGNNIEELNPRSFLEFVNVEDVPALRSQFDKALRHGEGHNIPFRLRERNGRDHHITMDILTRYTPEGKPLHLRCFMLDVTERVQTETELRRRTQQLTDANESLQRINRDLERLKESYRDLYHNAPVWYFSLDARGHFVACNETMLKALGYSRSDVHDRPMERILTLSSRDQYRQMRDLFQQAGETESQWVKKDSTVIDVWIRTVPILDHDGRFVRSRSVAQDVTERNRLANALRDRANELRMVNDNLRRTNRELDDFTYVVSHDLKEPLRTLQAFSNFLMEDYGSQLGGEGKEYIDHLIHASRRLGLLIDDLLVLSRAGRVVNTLQVFELGDLVTTVCTDLTNLIKRKEATVQAEGALPKVLGDPQRISQLLTNLVGNALKYNDHPHPEVILGTMPPGMVHRNGPEELLLPPNSVVIFVRDNGIGIDPRFHEQIFGMFRRLHLPEEYEGTGAGLAICKKIVEAHGGRIWVHSHPGQGSTFYFSVQRPGTSSSQQVGKPIAGELTSR